MRARGTSGLLAMFHVHCIERCEFTHIDGDIFVMRHSATFRVTYFTVIKSLAALNLTARALGPALMRKVFSIIHIGL